MQRALWYLVTVVSRLWLYLPTQFFTTHFHGPITVSLMLGKKLLPSPVLERNARQSHKLREGSEQTWASHEQKVHRLSSLSGLPLGVWSKTEGIDVLCDLLLPKCRIKSCGEGEPGLLIKANTAEHVVKMMKCVNHTKCLNHGN